MGAATSDGRSAAEPDDTVILLTCNEIRRLFIGLRARVHPVESSCTGLDGDATTKPSSGLPLQATAE